MNLLNVVELDLTKKPIKFKTYRELENHIIQIISKQYTFLHMIIPSEYAINYDISIANNWNNPMFLSIMQYTDKVTVIDSRGRRKIVKNRYEFNLPKVTRIEF